MIKISKSLQKKIRDFISDSRYEEHNNHDYRGEFYEDRCIDTYYNVRIEFDTIWCYVEVSDRRGNKQSVNIPNRRSESELVDIIYKTIEVLEFMI